MKGKYINTQIWITCVSSQRSKQKSGLNKKSKLRMVIGTETPALLSSLPLRSYYQVA